MQIQIRRGKMLETSSKLLWVFLQILYFFLLTNILTISSGKEVWFLETAVFGNSN
jgi:hypothetical protein